MRTLGMLVAAGALIALFVALGRWQLTRAAEQRVVADTFAAGSAAGEIDGLPDANAAVEFRYRRLRLTGRYLPEVQVLSDNMTHDGVAGYHVLTPFAADPDGAAVMVNRGWVPASPYRSELPDVAIDGRPRTVRARLDAFPAPALRLTDDGPAPAGKLRVMSFPEPGDLEQALGRRIAPYQALLDPTDPDGFVRAWSPSGPPPERNLAYAWQWFALAALTAVITVALWLRPLIGKRA